VSSKITARDVLETATRMVQKAARTRNAFERAKWIDAATSQLETARQLSRTEPPGAP
jgi:hypothetical protein